MRVLLLAEVLCPQCLVRMSTTIVSKASRKIRVVHPVYMPDFDDWECPNAGGVMETDVVNLTKTAEI